MIHQKNSVSTKLRQLKQLQKENTDFEEFAGLVAPSAADESEAEPQAEKEGDEEDGGDDNVGDRRRRSPALSSRYTIRAEVQTWQDRIDHLTASLDQHRKWIKQRTSILMDQSR